MAGLVLRGGRGADLLLVDVALDIRDLVMRLEAEHIHVPIVACGISNDARAAVAAIHAGAKEYIPLPPEPELIAAVLAAVANDSRDLVYRDDAMAKVIKLAQQIAPSDAGDLQKLASLGGSVDKAPFRSSVDDYYFTNAIARCSAIMAECSAIAHGRASVTAAE